MRLPAHLRRGPTGLFCFRIAVPADLRPCFGLTEIVRTLNTRSPREAQLLAYNLSARTLDQFQRIRDAMPYDPGKFDPANPATWPRQDDSLRDMVVRFPNGTVIEADPNNPKDIKAALAAVKMMQEMPAQPAPVVVQAAPASIATLDPQLRPCRLSQAVSEYLASFTAKSPKTLPKYRRALDHFLNWLTEKSGFTEKDPYVHEVTPEHISKWKDQLRADAEERAKKKRERPEERAKLAADPQLAKRPPELKLRTADGYLEPLSAFFHEMQILGRYPRLLAPPTAGQKFVSKSERYAMPGYRPFTEGELKKIFAPDNYASLKKPHEYWFPLISLLTGARREEIAQMGMEDIRHEGGQWIIDINDRDWRSVKSAAGVRVIPMHPVLVELGLPQYLDTVRSVVPSALRVFPYLRLDATNGFGDVPGEAFARYLDRLGITARDKVMHSLRKNANGRLDKNGIGEDHRARMVGHSHDTVNVSFYTDRCAAITLETLSAHVLPKLTFPELDLPALARPEGFADSLRNEMILSNRRRLQAERRKERAARGGRKGAAPLGSKS